jgi:hypothetical protein
MVPPAPVLSKSRTCVADMMDVGDRRIDFRGHYGSHVGSG